MPGGLGPSRVHRLHKTSARMRPPLGAVGPPPAWPGVVRVARIRVARRPSRRVVPDREGAPQKNPNRGTLSEKTPRVWRKRQLPANRRDFLLWVWVRTRTSASFLFSGFFLFSSAAFLFSGWKQEDGGRRKFRWLRRADGKPTILYLAVYLIYCFKFIRG